MMNWTLSGGTALALFVLGSGARAEVTAEEVWQDWQALSSSAGQQLTIGSAARTGDALKVTGLVVSFADDLGGSFVAEVGTLTFTERGDGTVEVTMADSYPMTLTFPPDDPDSPASLTLGIAQPGISIIAGGSAGETRYDFTAPSVTISLEELKAKDGTVVDADADLVLSGMTGSYLVTGAGGTSILDSSFAVASTAFTLTGSNPEAATGITLAVTLADLAGTSKGNLLGAEIMANMATALNAGFAVDSGFSYGPLSFSAEVTEATGPTNITGTATGGSFALGMNKARVTYGSVLNGAAITVSGAQIPFPQVAVAFGETAFNVSLPASRSDTPQDFAFLTKLVDFTISDEVWGLFDPAGTLSRAPATLILDARGTGFWHRDIMDPAARTDGTEPPGELTSLDLTEVLVRAAGAEVGATGALTFDNADLVTFDGMPAPTGTIDVTIRGANTLVDNLIAIGLLPEDQAMGFRMMLGMFARPGAGPDDLVSQLEFRDKGFFANGQQLK